LKVTFDLCTNILVCRLCKEHRTCVYMVQYTMYLGVFLEDFYDYRAIFQMELVPKLKTRVSHVKSVRQYEPATSVLGNNDQFNSFIMAFYAFNFNCNFNFKQFSGIDGTW